MNTISEYTVNALIAHPKNKPWGVVITNIKKRSTEKWFTTLAARTLWVIKHKKDIIDIAYRDPKK